MARTKDQEARRAQLSQAAGRALLGQGLEGLQLQDVAEEAREWPAAVLYYCSEDLERPDERGLQAEP